MRSCSGLFSCFWYSMYFRITSAVTLSPTLLTKYPSPHIFPDHISSLILGNLLNTSRAEMLFNTCTTCAGAYPGGTSINTCTWSSITSIVSMCHSYSSAIRLNTSFKYRPTSPPSKCTLYFGTHTMWYLRSYTACLVRLVPMPPYITRTGLSAITPVSPYRANTLSSPQQAGGYPARFL